MMNSYSNVKKKYSGTASAVKLFNIILYVLIYAGYIKLLFPQVGTVLTVLQYLGMVLGLVFILISTDKRILINTKPFSTLGWIFLCFIILSLEYYRTYNSTFARSKISAFLITAIYSIFIYIYSRNLSDDEALQSFISTIVNVNTLVVLLYIAIHITSILSLIRQGLRGGDVYSNPIWIARLCSDTVILIFCGSKSKFTPIQIFRIVMLFGIAILMGSKGPIIATGIVLLIYYQSRGNLNYKLLATIAAIIIIGIIAFFIARTNSSFIRSRFSLSSILVSSPGYRISRYEYTLKKIPKNFWIGYGLGNWPIDYWRSVSFTPAWVTNEMKLIDYPHNMVLEIMYDGGLVSLIPFIASLFSIRKHSRYYGELQNTRPLFLLIIANFIYAMFSGGITIGNTGFYYFIALYCGIQNARAVANIQ